MLADEHGTVLDALPPDPTLIGRRLTARFPSAAAAAAATESGSTAVSNVINAGVGAGDVTAVAVPFATPRSGRRVFAAAYAVRSPQLEAFVARAIAYPQHEVLLVDGLGNVLAASPDTAAGTLARAHPALARASATATVGPVPGAPTPSTFTIAPIAGTPWSMVLMVPDNRLFATVQGLEQVLPWLIFALVSMLGLLLLGLFARSLRDRARLGRLSEELDLAARTDPLTGLANRRGLKEALSRAGSRARRSGEPLSVLMIDLDRFKQVNDTHGHDAGDRVLCELAACLRDVLRGEDVYGRLGGDEFVVAIEGGEPQARAVARRLTDAAAARRMPELGLDEGIPMSVGLASGAHQLPEDLMRAADVELYRVKESHRANAAARTAT